MVGIKYVFRMSGYVSASMVDDGGYGMSLEIERQNGRLQQMVLERVYDEKTTPLELLRSGVVFRTTTTHDGDRIRIVVEWSTGLV